MKVSLNTIKQFIDFQLPPVAELVDRINQQLGGVEEVIDLGAKYKNIVIAKVVSCEPHPDSDHLHICQIEVGDNPEYAKFKIPDSDFVQVVCGAPNVHADMFVAWLPPGATVPASYDKDPFVLDARTIRGVESNGMLASPAELAIGDNHEGILEITEKDLSPAVALPLEPGQDFAALFGLNDTIIDIENKMFTHRPDCFGQLGVAREIAGIHGQKFTSPEWYLSIPEFVAGDGLQLTVLNEAEEKVPHFMAVTIKNVEIKPSPFWLQCELVRLGSKPINNIVDITNYVMLHTAQPLHAYDYDKLRGYTLGARMGRAVEKLTLLNGKTYEVTEDDIVIVDAEGPVGMGGVMGGGNSEVSADTKNVVLECATFDMYAIRKTSMRHGLFTDAVTRFNKGQSPLQNPACLFQALNMVLELAGGSQAGAVADLVSGDELAARIQAHEGALPQSIMPQFIRDRLGLGIKKYDMVQLLGNVEFPLCEDCGWDPEDEQDNNEELHINVPFWRTDVELPEDIVEEVGRLYGFDKLPRELPQRSMKPAPLNVRLEMKRKIRHILSGAGANEVLTYSFVHEKVLKGAGQDPAQAFRLGNALSPDLQYYRLSLIPSLLDKVHVNIKAGHDEFALFEFGKAHRKGDLGEDGLPREYERLAFVYAAKKYPYAAFYAARQYVEMLSDSLVYVPLSEFDSSTHAIFEQLSKPFEPKRAAVVFDREQFVGVVGEFSAATRRAFKLPEGAAGFELFQSFLLRLAPKQYVPLPRFPSVTQDISLRISIATPYADVLTAAESALDQLRTEVQLLELTPLGIYQPDAGQTKTVTLRLRATNTLRTLTDTEVTSYIDSIAEMATKEVGAEKI
ncbi:MAG: phenylalanine--tRNA ligase subunit beta [Candidatus Saccharimonadales bacterium]